MQENVSSMLSKWIAFDEDGSSKSLSDYAKSIDIQKDKVLTNSGLNTVKKLFPKAI